MRARLTDIQRRRDALVARAAEQRDALNELIQPWRTRLTRADRLIAFARDARARWFTLAALGLLISQLGQCKRGAWIARLWTAWDMFGALRKRRTRTRP